MTDTKSTSASSHWCKNHIKNQIHQSVVLIDLHHRPQWREIFHEGVAATSLPVDSLYMIVLPAASALCYFIFWNETNRLGKQSDTCRYHGVQNHAILQLPEGVCTYKKKALKAETTICHSLSSDRLAPSPGLLYSFHPSKVLSTSAMLGLPGRGLSPQTAWMWPTAHYSAMMLGGGGVSAHVRCYGDDATAVYCSSGPHVRRQMWPENAKNEACFPLLHYVCLSVWLTDSYGAVWDGPPTSLRPGSYKGREGWVEILNVGWIKNQWLCLRLFSACVIPPLPCLHQRMGSVLGQPYWANAIRIFLLYVTKAEVGCQKRAATLFEVLFDLRELHGLEQSRMFSRSLSWTLSKPQCI